MPAKSPPRGPILENTLSALGKKIQARRKAIKVSAVATAEAAGISRMTLNRIERGEPSVTLGAYTNVISVLGLELQLVDPKVEKGAQPISGLSKKSRIRLSDYPQLKELAWQIKKTQSLKPEEALNIYERNWRHINFQEMDESEKKLIKDLRDLFGSEKLLV